jgi:hypothetical protein
MTNAPRIGERLEAVAATILGHELAAGPALASTLPARDLPSETEFEPATSHRITTCRRTEREEM